MTFRGSVIDYPYLSSRLERALAGATEEDKQRNRSGYVPPLFEANWKAEGAFSDGLGLSTSSADEIGPVQARG